MSTRKRAIVYEDFRWIHVLGAVVRWLFGCQIFLRTLPLSNRLRNFIKPLIESGYVYKLKLKDWPYRVYNPSIDMAFEFTKREYMSRFSSCTIPAMLVKLYDDDRVHIAFKKSLSEYLQKYFEFNLWCEAIERRFDGNWTWKYVPVFPERAFTPHVVKDSENSKLLTWGATLRGRIRMVKVVIRSVGMAFVFWLRAFSGWARKKNVRLLPETIDFVVAIVSPGREFVYGVRGLEFIIDGIRVRKDNTLFVPLAPLSVEHEIHAKSRGLRLAVHGGWNSIEEIRRAFFILSILFLCSLSAEPWMTFAATNLIREHLKWKAFLRQYKPKQFVSYAEYSVLHIGRNLTLGKAGVKSLYYADAEFTYETMPGPSYRDIGFGFMTFDRCVSWSPRYTRYMKRHHQEIKEYSCVGVLWSEQVRLLKEGKIFSDFPKRVSENGWNSSLRIVAVFDVFYHNDGWLTLKDGIHFAKGILNLLEDYHNIFVIFKEKKWPEFYTSENSDELREIYKTLSSHNRCFFPGYNVATPEVLAIADLCISFPFGSPVVEALGAGVKAIYFAPDKKYAGGYYERVPDLVVYEYETLSRRVNDLLWKTSEEQYHEYLMTFVKGDIDPYLDAHGLTRFRNLLVSETS